MRRILWGTKFAARDFVGWLIAYFAYLPSSPSLQVVLMNRIWRPGRRLKQILRKFWREFIIDECPDEKERIRQERINNIMHNVVLLEAMRRWEIESEGRKTKSRQ